MVSYPVPEGGRDLSKATIGIIINNADDEGGEADVSCHRTAFAIGRQVHTAFCATGAFLNDEAEIQYDDLQYADDPPNMQKLGAVVRATTQGADAVQKTLEAGKTVLSIGGNHVRGFDVIGALRYCHEQGIELGLIWVDAHPDLNTPETTPSGHLHGMVAAVLTGKGPKELLALMKDAPFLKPENILYVGLNSIDDQEDVPSTERDYLEELKAKGMKVFEMEDVRNPEQEDAMPQPVLDAVSDLAKRLESKGGKVWVELDVDVFRKEDVPSSVMAGAGEMRVEQGYELFRHIGKTCHPLGIGVSELAPDKDEDGKGGDTVARCVAYAMGVQDSQIELDPDKTLAFGFRRIQKQPGCEYVMRSDFSMSYPCFVIRDGKVVELKSWKVILPDYKVGSRVRITPRMVEHWGDHGGTIRSIRLPETDALHRNNHIIEVAFDGGFSRWHPMGELEVIEE